MSLNCQISLSGEKYLGLEEYPMKFRWNLFSFEVNPELHLAIFYSCQAMFYKIRRPFPEIESQSLAQSAKIRCIVN